MKPNAAQFKRKTAASTTDTTLRGNLQNNLTQLHDRRTLAFQGINAGEMLRDLGESLKREALSRLPDLLEELETNLTRNGIQVHWAETTEEANQIVLEIAQRRGVKLAVKGKSMVSEEMELNAYLEKHGIEAIEADLGEFIVQLAEEPPSHIIAPAAHYNRAQVGKLFEEKLNQPYTEVAEEMTAVARTVLREKFKNADMGITGVNFAVAETGTIALVENEGNGRMATSVPPVHVALMGLEKVVPKIEDIPVLIRLLCRSATGQSISNYFNWVASPRKAGEKDGPEEVHLVILDNGRSRAYSDRQLRDTLDCIRCAACLNACPVYRRTGGHAYDSVYMGPIGKILTPQLAGLEDGGHLAGASTLCGACAEVCPVRIPLPSLLLRLRQEGAQPTAAGRATVKGAGAKRTMGEAMVWKGWQVIHSRPAAYRAWSKLARMAAGMAPKSIGPMKGWTRHRNLPTPAGESLRDLLRDRDRE